VQNKAMLCFAECEALRVLWFDLGGEGASPPYILFRRVCEGGVFLAKPLSNGVPG